MRALVVALVVVGACAPAREAYDGPTHPTVDIVIDAADHVRVDVYPELPAGCTCNRSLARDGCGGGWSDRGYGQCHCEDRGLVESEVELRGCLEEASVDDATHTLTLKGCDQAFPLESVVAEPPAIVDFVAVAGAQRPQATFDGGRVQVCTSYDWFWDSCCDATDAPVDVHEMWRREYSVRADRLVGPIALDDPSGTTRVWWRFEGEHTSGAVAPIARSDGLWELERDGTDERIVFDVADPSWFRHEWPDGSAQTLRSDVDNVRVVQDGAIYEGSYTHAPRDVSISLGTFGGRTVVGERVTVTLTNVDDPADVIERELWSDAITLPSVARPE
jgi:hypothetical protein